MYRAASRKIGIFLTGFILLAWVVILPPSLSAAGLHELSDGEMAAVYAQGFSEFTLTDDTVKLNFTGVTLSTWTELSALRMGYYSGGWDQEWTGTGTTTGTVSLGTSANDLLITAPYIEAKFSNIGSATTRQLEYVHIGAKYLTGTITANFSSFIGTIGASSYPTRSNLGVQTITSDGTTGFYLSLDRIGGYSFNFGTGSHL